MREAITLKVNDCVEDKVEVGSGGMMVDGVQAEPGRQQFKKLSEATGNIQIHYDILYLDPNSESEIVYLLLRGPIIYLKNGDCLMYLPTCV